MTCTWLGMAAGIFLLFFCCVGYRRGFIREIVSVFFVFLAMALVWFVNPYVNEFLRNNTPLYEKIQEGCENLVQIQGSTQGLGQEEQRNLIENLSLPSLLRDGLVENNTADVYRYLAVSTFGEYVAGYLATAVINGISFLISYILSSVIIRTAVYALNLIAGLPVLKGMNKLAGALLGGVKGVIFIWIAFLVLTVLCNTEAGRSGLELIEKDALLNFLYERDIFVKIFMNIFYAK